jgi:hypothetical protein
MTNVAVFLRETLRLGDFKKVTQPFWKAILWFLLGGGLLFLISAVLLAATIHSLDLSIHDKYVAIFPSRLLIISAVLLAATYVVWKAKFSH